MTGVPWPVWVGLAVLVAWGLSLELRVRQHRTLLFGDEERDSILGHAVDAVRDAVTHAVPGHAKEAREVRAQTVARGADDIQARARADGLVISRKDAEQVAALMLSEVGL